MKTKITMRMVRPSYYASLYKITKIEGYIPHSPKVGDQMGLHDLATMVYNGCTVTVEPPTKEEKQEIGQ